MFIVYVSGYWCVPLQGFYRDGNEHFGRRTCWDHMDEDVDMNMGEEGRRENKWENDEKLVRYPFYFYFLFI